MNVGSKSLGATLIVLRIYMIENASCQPRNQENSQWYMMARLLKSCWGQGAW